MMVSWYALQGNGIFQPEITSTADFGGGMGALVRGSRRVSLSQGPRVAGVGLVRPGPFSHGR